MTSSTEPVVRDAGPDDVVAICRFGEAHVGVGQRGRRGTDHVVYKLYIDPGHRGRGLGPQLLHALTGQLPADAERQYVEHFVANERAGAFYEREGFAVERIEPSLTGNPALGVVWRARPMPMVAKTSGPA